jgi:hypothetical protein
MALMLSSLYDALLDAGASEEKARKAAEEAAMYETRLTRMDSVLDSLAHRLNALTWSIGIGFSLVLAVLLLELNWLWQLLQRVH